MKFFYKRCFDVMVIVVAHILLLPIWAMIWMIIPLLILMEDGLPIFYKQERMGYNGRIFIVRKFRTMIKDADKNGPAWTKENDPRVTKVGKILRKTALDELPSLLSIIKGDMSFVGPRALAVDEQKYLEESIAGYEKRLCVLPGLTGLAQICNPYDDPYDKLKYDLEYINKMSVWLDIKIICISVFNTITARWDKRKGKECLDVSVNSKHKG